MLDKELGKKRNFVTIYVDSSETFICTKMERSINSHIDGVEEMAKLTALIKKKNLSRFFFHLETTSRFYSQNRK